MLRCPMFLFLHTACLHNSVVADTDSGSVLAETDSGADTEPADVPIALWVWTPSIAGDEDATADLLSFAADQGVSTLFFTCDEVGYGIAGAVERYTTFVDAAHLAGIAVFGMTGYSWFSVPCDAGLSGQDTCWTEGWTVFETCAASGVGFDGFMDDTEPASTPDGSFFTDFQQRAQWHLDYLRGIRERIGDLPLHHATPAWYDDLEPLALDDGATEATLDVWIAGVVDVVGVMAYRDSAEEVLPLAATELSRGPIWIGLETGPSSEGEGITFEDDGAAALEAAMSALADSTRDEPNLRGFMVDSYETWRSLPE